MKMKHKIKHKIEKKFLEQNGTFGELCKVYKWIKDVNVIGGHGLFISSTETCVAIFSSPTTEASTREVVAAIFASAPLALETQSLTSGTLILAPETQVLASIT